MHKRILVRSTFTFAFFLLTFNFSPAVGAQAAADPTRPRFTQASTNVFRRFAVDLAKMKEFYGDVLELQLIDETSFALVLDAHGTMLRVTIVQRVHAAPYTVLGWEVENIAQAVEHLTSRGVEFLRYEGMAQDEQGIWDSPSGGRIAWFRDPEQNILSLTQF